MQIITVAGLSGSGKTSIVQILSDEGYLILDSLTANTIEPVLNIILSDNSEAKIALVVDFIDKHEFELKHQAIERVAAKDEVELLRFFVTCSDGKIISRYKEQRRMHPLMITKKFDSLEESIKLEQKTLSYYASISDYTFDTTSLSVVNLRKQVLASLKTKAQFSINVVSFGFKHGFVSEADYVFDVRFLPNPFYNPELRVKTGLDDDVYDYVFNFEDANKFYDGIKAIMDIALANFENEGRVVTTIAFGCTGGQHRSVSFARRLANELTDKYEVNLVHKEIK